MKFIPLLLLCITTLFFSCGSHKENKLPANGADTLTAAKPRLYLDTFSTAPAGLTASCYLANDSLECRNYKFIYIGDDKHCYLKINGILTTFNRNDNGMLNEKKVFTAKSDEYELAIEVLKSAPVGEGSYQMAGTLKLTDKNNSTLIKSFYGECGY